jgi:uncharacterized protein DUF4056
MPRVPADLQRLAEIPGIEMNRLIAVMFLGTAGILLLFPHEAAFSQCNMSPDPAPKINPGPPGQRWCCSLGTQTGIDASGLKGHQYGHEIQLGSQIRGNLPGGEPLGYIYTSGAGLVDIGHVRDNADMVLYVYMQLFGAQHTIYTSGGDEVAVPNIPTAKDQMLAIAGAIVFVNSWAHELTTWGYTNVFSSLKAEDFSAFSPEDMSSNIVGIYTATRAITNMTITPTSLGPDIVKQFNEQMDLMLPMIIASLGPESAEETTELLNETVNFTGVAGSKDLTGKWWMFDIAPGNTMIELLRRNFDGAAWKVPGTPQAPATPAWLNTTRFSSLYPQFLYLVRNNPKKLNEIADVDATQVPATNTYALSTELKPLAWVPTPAQPNTSDALPVEGSTDPFCLMTPQRVPIPSGQFTQVKVNVYPGQQQDVVWSFAHATKFLQDNFTAVNPNMDGPVTYVAPDIPRPIQ